MVAINEILLRECAGEGCGGDNDICTDSLVHHRKAENRAPVTRNHRSAPILGRWLTRDPFGYQGGINLYEYVGGGPSRRLDPPGQRPVHLGRGQMTQLAIAVAAQLAKDGYYGLSKKNQGSVLYRAKRFSGLSLQFPALASYLEVTLLKAAEMISHMDFTEEYDLADKISKHILENVREFAERIFDYYSKIGAETVVAQSARRGSQGCYANMVLIYDPQNQTFFGDVTGRVGWYHMATGMFSISCSRACDVSDFTLNVTGTYRRTLKGKNFTGFQVTGMQVSGGH